MNLPKMLDCIDEFECIVLSDGENDAIIDKDDEFETIEGEEYVLLRHSNGKEPIPTSIFEKAMVIRKEELVFHELAKIICE